MTLLIVFYEFFKIGLFTVGGGLAALPFLQQLISKYGWITSDQLLDMIAISESTPGPIGINVATFVGYRTAGIFGGVLATLSVALPSLIIILLVANWLRKVNEHPVVQGAFAGIRPAVAGLIGAVALELGQNDLLHRPTGNAVAWLEYFNWPGLALFSVIMVAMLRFKVHPIALLGSAAIIGLVFRF